MIPYSALVSSHITSSIARSPQAYRSLLSSDLQELISSGMLTIKAKLNPVLNEKEGLLAVNPGKVLGRVAEVWGFFFSIVPVSSSGRGSNGIVLEDQDVDDGIFGNAI